MNPERRHSPPPGTAGPTTSADTTTLDRAAEFAELHRGASPLLLASAWDAGTGEVIRVLGFQGTGIFEQDARFAYDLARRR